ncbi:hypothetical protein CHS0354_028038 [Potamilus streckersoni]|uniref:Uncharacterized protein n=1 Tax=Potamilus streckersoni TaxID=2493646 RepID=A0AAE0THU8_9BIVA|nr:hypothetical protein CHS0354_028038 [Potamilus streckersoni]
MLFKGSTSEARLNRNWTGSDTKQSPSSQDTNGGTSVPIWNTSFAVFTTISTTTLPMISASSNNINMTVDDPNVSGVFTYEFYLLVYGTSLVGILLLQIMKSIGGIKVTITAASNLHNEVLDKVVKAPMKFFDTNPAGRVLNRFSKDMDEADVFLPQLIHALFQIMNQSVLSILLTVYYVPWILVAAVPVVALFWVMKSIMAVSTRQLKRLENVSRSPLLSHVTTSAQGLSAIVTYKQEQRFYENCMSFGDVVSVATFLFECSMRWIGLRLDLLAAMLTISTAATLVLAKSAIPPAVAGLTLGLCSRIVSVMQFLVRVANETEARFTSIERINEYKETLESEKDEQPPAHEKWPDQGAIIFSRVVMKYKEDAEPVLKNIDLDIHPGEKVGIIGRTGAGKSSLATVLLRLVELSGGHIHIDGVDISLISLQSLRSNLSTIPQDPVLFAGTVRYNVDPFSQYQDEEIWSALEKVQMKQKITQCEKGLQMLVDENGENFSVGERQLLCLARAVLRKNKILVLDEATANIDMGTDAIIQSTIKECFGQCTVITIAHRLNTVLHSDKIVIMDSGKVMECGSPDELLSNPNSFFNAMISSQTFKTPSS